MVPPLAVALNVTDCTVEAVLGPLTVTASVRAEIVTVADAEAVFALLSVAVTLIVYVPLTLYVVLKLEVVPLAGEPPVAVHAKVYGAVPPVADAVHATAVPTVPVAGHEMVAERASGLTVVVTVLDVAVFEFESVTVTTIVSVPFVVKVVVNVADVPVWTTPLRVNPNVYGEVPPVADAV